ncbi:MAG: 50S ribosomal protein L4 [Bacteroidales bacterium]
MELKVYNRNGQETSNTVTLDDAVFGIEPNDHAIYLDVKQHLANCRQGTHKAKERSEVAGSTRKIKRQKGTGTARFGDIKNPLFRGGGRIFGPKPRDYSFKLNRKMKRIARLSAMAYKIKDQQLTVVENFSMEAPKTRDFVEMMKNFNLAGKRVLLILDQKDENLYLASRNVQGTRIIRPTSVNTYDLMNAHHVLISESSIREFEKLHTVNK